MHPDDRVLMGLTRALQFVFPDLVRGIPWLVFSRFRQAQVNTVLFAWLSGAMMGMLLYIVPQLTGQRLWSEPLGNVTAICGAWPCWRASSAC
jgi:cytochrome c oxidase cbb3-type subunit I/II